MTKGIPVFKIREAATDEGVLYENLMFLWVLLGLLEDDRIEQFNIAQNVNDVGAFDDLVFCVKYKPNGQNKLFLVQLKHINKPISMDKLVAPGGGEYKLLKYYKDFKGVGENVKKFKNIVLNEYEMQDITFIICTIAESRLWDDSYPKDSLCQELLNTGGKASKMISFSSKKLIVEFQEKLTKQNSPIIQEKSGEKFQQQLLFFFEQSNNSDLKVKLQEKLEKYFVTENISTKDILRMALDFIAENNEMWISNHSGVLSNVSINFQGFPVKLSDMQSHWKNPKLCRKIIVKHVCQETGSLVSVGKIINPPAEYFIKRRVEKDIMGTNILDEKFVILSAPPGMGKSFYFTKQAYEVKKSNPGLYVIRENLLDHASYLQFLDISGSNNVAEEFLIEMAGVKPDTLDYNVFRCCLQGDNRMVIFLDGMDEINPDYFDKVCHIIHAIRVEFHVQLWVSTRTILKDQMKKYFEQEFWTLSEFTSDEAKQFLNKYCGEKFCNLGETEEKLCVIPLLCKMLGDIINGSNLKHSVDAIKSKVDLYDKFIEVKFQVYYERYKVNTSVPATRIVMNNCKKEAMKNFEIVAVLAIFGKEKVSELKWNIIAECKDVLDLLSEGIEYFGIVSKMKNDTPIFIHQSFAEYFCGQWFSRNTKRYKEYVDHPGNSRFTFPEEVDYFMSSKLNDANSLFSLVLNTMEENKLKNSLGKCADKFNELDPIGRHVLHYANLVNNYKALKYILFIGYNLTEANAAELGMYRQDITSVIGAKLVLGWLTAKLTKYPQNAPLLNLVLLTSSLQEYTLYFLMEHSRNSPLHLAILNQCREDITLLEEEHRNSKDELGLTPLHVAVWMDDVDTMKLLGEKEAEYRRDNAFGVYPHQFLSYYNEGIYYLLQQFFDTIMIEQALRGDIIAEDYISQKLPLHNAVQKKELRKYLESNSDVNSIRFGPDSKGRSILHVAAASSCDEIFGECLDKIEIYIEYTRDVSGYYPHHYARNIIIHNSLMNRGINSINSWLGPEETRINGLWWTELLNKIESTPDEYLESGDGIGLFTNLLLSSVRLKLLNKDPVDTFTSAQNGDEFSVFYDAVFRSKCQYPVEDKNLFKQYMTLNNHMFRQFYEAADKLSLDAQRAINVKINYFYAFIENNSEKFENLLNEHTLEKIASLVLPHLELMVEDMDHVKHCSCWKVLECGGETSGRT